MRAPDRRANPRLPRGFGDSLTNEEVDPLRARRQRAKEKFLDALQEAGGLTRAQAETAFESMRKNRMLDMRHASVSEHITVKHGSFLDRDIVRRAAGLRDEESRDRALPLSLSLYPKDWEAAPPPPPPHRPPARRAELPREQCGDCEWCASLDSTDKTRVEDADHAPMAPPASNWEMEHGHPRCEACHGQFYATRNVALSDAQKAGLEDIRAGRWLCSRHAEREAETPRRANPVPMEPASSAERRSLLLMDPGSLRSAYKQAEKELYAESRAGERDRLSKRACAILWALREKGERSPNPVGKPRRIDAEAALLRTRIESILREYGLEPMADYPTHMNSYADLILGGRWKGESPSWGPVEVALPSDRARGSDDFSATVLFESAPEEAARLLSPSDVAARGAIPFNGKVWVRERSADAVEKRIREILDRAFAGARAPNPIAIKQFTY